MQPLVTVLTPVHNGAAFLHECMDSVLAQDYENWHYIVVDNCSSDDTVAIAASYAHKDTRITVTTNRSFLSMAQNFNNAFAKVSPTSRYCKVVCADDWLYPRCLSRMVAFAQEHPSAGIVSCYQQSGPHVRWAELPPATTLLTGREACRLVLLEGAQILPAPTAALFRTDLLIGDEPFFPHEAPHVDTTACFVHLARCDLGIVHEVMAVERVHEGQITSRIAGMNAGDLAYVEALLEFGPRYLSAAELASRREVVLNDYYRSLGRGLLRLRGRQFWSFQRRRLEEIGLPLERLRIVVAAFEVAADHLKHPAASLRKGGAILRHRLGR